MLTRRMLFVPFPLQLPPGRPVSEAIDYELQDMKRRMGN